MKYMLLAFLFLMGCGDEKEPQVIMSDIIPTPSPTPFVPYPVKGYGVGSQR